MIFNKQIKVSENFGETYINHLTKYLKTVFDVKFIKKTEVEIDLIIFDYQIKGKKISFLSEGQEGTFIIGKKSIVMDILNRVSYDKSGFFDLIE